MADTDHDAITPPHGTPVAERWRCPACGLPAVVAANPIPGRALACPCCSAPVERLPDALVVTPEPLSETARLADEVMRCRRALRAVADTAAAALVIQIGERPYEESVRLYRTVDQLRRLAAEGLQ